MDHSRDARSDREAQLLSGLCSVQTVKKAFRSSLRNHLEGVCEEMEEHQKRNDSKGMFSTVNRLTKHVQQ